ncbi:hypothetical protein DL767_000730 [Monosporascus sp. MG133]|nr:hypothetical protein DL767_000730 [Monosporascus sp. MG133]
MCHRVDRIVSFLSTAKTAVGSAVKRQGRQPGFSDGLPVDGTAEGGNGPLTGSAPFVSHAGDHPHSMRSEASRSSLFVLQAEEWLYFHRGKARAAAFLGSSLARTVDFSVGDTAVFPDNGGHYIENILEKDEDLVQIEIYKGYRVEDIPPMQWLALTPADIVANLLGSPPRSPRT